MIIAGDIGGTKTNIALFENAGQGPGGTLAHKSYPSRSYPSLNAIVEEFIAEFRPEVTHACFGVAGPITNNRVSTTNLAWEVDMPALAEKLGLERAGLINDLEATAYGVEALTPEQLFTLNDGGTGFRDGHRGLIAAGTGLGMAGIFWDGERYHPMASEGGHVDFAPRDDLQIELLRWMWENVGGRVSIERVLSGPGLFNIYSFLRERKFAPEPEWLAEDVRRSADPTVPVSKAALAGRSELAMKALDLFVEIYGAMTGDLGLVLKSIGGLYVGGGIAPKILDKLRDGSFMRAFLDKGRLRPLVASMPVHVILDDKTALYGAARYALNSRH